jgi:hypothetical protein
MAALFRLNSRPRPSEVWVRGTAGTTRIDLEEIMNANRAVGVLSVIFVLGCGGSSSTPKPSSNQDAPVATRDAATSDVYVKNDLAIGTNPDLPGTPDSYVAPTKDGAVADTWIASGVETGPGTADLAPAVDLPSAGDLPASPDSPATSPDTAPTPDGSSALTSTTTPDNSTDPQICSTKKIGIKDVTADQTMDIVMDDCLRISGTVTLAGPLPSGAVWGNGELHFFKIVRDASNAITDTISYAASVTAVDDSHFTYSLGVPADSYEVLYMLAVKSSAQIPSIVTRFGQEHLVVSQSIKHDVTLPAIDVATRTVTVTGTDALASNGNAFGRMIEVIGVNAGHTLMVTGVNIGGGASVPISMWVPKEAITPFIMVEESPGATAPYPSGFVSQFLLDSVTPTADFSLALPAAVKISGTISDPSGSLSPVMGVGGTGTSAVSYYQCDSLDTGSFPNPLFFYPEGSTSAFFSSTTSHALYARKGLSCVTYANYAIATGAAGATPTRTGENTYAYMEDPTPKSPNAVTLTTDLVRNINVPNLGPQVTITGTVKDKRGNAIPSALLNFNSTSLVTASVADKTFVGSLDVSATGTFTAHALPGSYDMSVALPTTTTAPSKPDAGAPTSKDAAPDIGFTLPDLGAGGNCSTLAACCSTLSGTNKTVCDTLVSAGVDSSCSGELTVLKLQGLCP